MDIRIPPALVAPIATYLALLDRWNRTHALTALPPDQREEELVLDALHLVPHLAALPAGARVVDFGTGMGIPSVILAMARPDLQIFGMDKVSKKLAFLRQVKLELNLSNLEILGGRIEALPPVGAHAGTSKATGTLELLARWWDHHGQPGAPFYAFKGPEWAQEAQPEGFRLEPHAYPLPTRGSRVLIHMVRP